MDLQEAMNTIEDQKKTIDGLNGNLEEAQKNVSRLESEVARMNEAFMLNECSGIVADVLSESELPEVTKERIQQEAGKFMATKDDDSENGTKKKVLDKEKVKESVQEAVKFETDYIGKLTGGIKVTGMGRFDDDGKDLDESYDLTDAFKSIGLSESAAKIAANGR